MVKRNHNLKKLDLPHYNEYIRERKRLHLEKNPEAKLILLEIGEATLPFFDELSLDLCEYAINLSAMEGYSGYPDWNGPHELRHLVAGELYRGKVEADEIIISDGRRPDLARLLILFGKDVTIAVQDPGTPLVVSQSVISGKTGECDPTTRRFDNITYLRCRKENNFFPDLNVDRTDLIYFASPNNPTGAVATYEQLEKLVVFALQNKSFILFDSSDREYISDPRLPKTIFEIPGAEKCAIEISSFSKLFGSAGLHLGMTVCPKTVAYEDGQSVWADWKRVVGTTTNGPSIMDSAAGVFTMKNYDLFGNTIQYYMKNCKLIRAVLEKKGIPCYGGIDSPFIWCEFEGKSSWDIFDSLLEVNIVCSPGSGFGPRWEGYIRFSCFATPEEIAEAVKILEVWDPKTCVNNTDPDPSAPSMCTKTCLSTSLHA